LAQDWGFLDGSTGSAIEFHHGLEQFIFDPMSA
jgi:hypothetical protein